MQVISRGELENSYQQLVEDQSKIGIKLYSILQPAKLIQEEISRELEVDQLVKKTADIIMGLFGSKRCLNLYGG